MIRILYRTPSGHLRTDVTKDELGTVLAEQGGLLWLDLTGEPPDQCEPILRETFAFHPLAVEDVLHQVHVPKLDSWGEYLLAILHAVVSSEGPAQQAKIGSQELDAFLGTSYLVTFSEQPIDAVQRVWEACQRDTRHLESGADHILYLLADALATNAISVVEQMRGHIDRIEDQLFENPTPQTLEQIFTLKRAILRLRRTLSPQSEVLGRLSREDYPMIDARDRAYFRDVYDHYVRLDVLNESLRELVVGAVDTYLSLVNNRMNEAMRTLAVITTLFMPISFLAGFFGMNFFGPVASLDIWTDKPILFVTLGLMLALPVGMYSWIRRRGWM